MKTKVRIRYAKLGTLAFTGHLDVANLIPKLLRRCNLELAYSQGFSPRPKMAFTQPLPLGCESTAEFCDIELLNSVDDRTLENAKLRVNELFPDFKFVLSMRILSEEPSISNAVKFAVYKYLYKNNIETAQVVDILESKVQIVVLTKDKSERNLQPYVHSFRAGDDNLELTCVNNGELIFPPLKFANAICDITRSSVPTIFKTKLLDANMNEIV